MFADPSEMQQRSAVGVVSRGLDNSNYLTTIIDAKSFVVIVNVTA
jgi:hypothetical protein